MPTLKEKVFSRITEDFQVLAKIVIRQLNLTKQLMDDNHKEEIYTEINNNERIIDSIEEEERVKVLKLKEEKLKAETEKDHAYCLKINQMDDEAFAKYHAEQVAKANDTVIKDAERTKKDAEAEIVKMRLETKEKINRIREECLKKVEVADKKRDDALEKYDAINTLFTNKDEILRAKEALDAAVEKDKRNKEDRDELLESIKAMLED